MVVQTFRTSTPRVIGVELDLEKLRLRFWIDGKPLEDMSKNVPAGKAWIPTVHFAEPDLEVVLNPYCVSGGSSSSIGLGAKAARDLREDARCGGQHSFPACLSQSTAALQSAFLAAELDCLVVAYDERDFQQGASDAPKEDAAKRRAVFEKAFVRGELPAGVV